MVELAWLAHNGCTKHNNIDEVDLTRLLIANTEPDFQKRTGQIPIYKQLSYV